MDESIWTPAEYREFMKSIKHRHFGPAIAPIAGWAMLMIAALFLIPTLIMLVMHGSVALPPGTSLKAWFWVLVGLVWIYAGYRLTRSFGIDAETMRQEMLARARCASCGYSLAGIPREDDGCTVCPECASAWRVPDLTMRCTGKSAMLTEPAS